jgi:two-component system, sensor histidine kinase RegB
MPNPLKRAAMTTVPAHPSHPLRTVRVDTLVRLRWLAIAGQAATVLLVHFALDFKVPFAACATVVGVAAWLNLTVRLRYGVTRRLEPEQAAWLLAFDIAQLTMLLYLTGGIDNPFSFMLLAPVVISATALPPRITMALGGLAVLCATALVFLHLPLPWASDDTLRFPALYTLGDWGSIIIAIVFISVYAWQISEETRQMADALTATELALAREQHLSQLDGLAAAAAHELATPLSTIMVIAKELERELEPNSPHAADVHLLREQAQRCRDILGKLTELPASGAPFDRMKLSTLLEEVIAPHRNFGIDIDVVLPAERADEPVGARNPAILYGLGNLVENAVDFAKSRVEVAARWSVQEVVVTIADDGPGFSPEVKEHMGEPYVTSRGRRPAPVDGEPTGLGLGFFIAKTLLERSGATLALANRPAPETGAVVRLRWGHADFERPLGPE